MAALLDPQICQVDLCSVGDATRVALPQTRVETLIDSQPKFEIQIK